MDCPYCGLANNNKKVGDVYCSRLSNNIEQPDNSIFKIELQKRIHTDNHLTRLTLRMTLDHSHHYQVDGCRKEVKPGRFLLMNQGQQYRISTSDTGKTNLLGIAFNPKYVSGYLYTRLNKESYLLDNPGGLIDTSFLQGVHEINPVMERLVKEVGSYVTSPVACPEEQLQYMFNSVIDQLIMLDGRLHAQALSLGTIKNSTRRELLKRLMMARDYMDAGASGIRNIEEVARQACLSEFHFYRSFKKVFGISPNQYLSKQKLDRSATLLKESQQTISEVSGNAGFEDHSSFSRLFKKKYGCTPSLYRMLHQA